MGGNPDLKPQEADTSSIGVDLTPGFLPGFRASLTYYNIDFTNAIATIPESSALFTSAYAPFLFLEPELAFIEAFTAGTRLVGAPSLASLYESGNSPLYFADFRRNNLGGVKTDGIDFAYAVCQCHPRSGQTSGPKSRAPARPRRGEPSFSWQMTADDERGTT